ncbi:uncharacterized protein VTP21DRAFT_9113 [Calcarisporiella thermophila]|uniref:uncharacterized protein n=1 Tax=Calcarisporiella thermophila TaxID=911321 RepID=UPI00374228F6
MATKQAYKRLTKEYMLLQRAPPDYITAKPLESNILEWHYILTGPPESPYQGGEYHGKLSFPPEYPFKPPAIRMFTPNGRFQVNTRLCLTMSDFHPSSWNPSWSVATILNGLLSFMLSNEVTTGSINTSDDDKRIYAARSHAFNRASAKFREVFPDMCAQQISPDPTPPISLAQTTAVPRRTCNPALNLPTGKAPIPSANIATLNRGSRPWVIGRRWVVLATLLGYLLLAKLVSRFS